MGIYFEDHKRSKLVTCMLIDSSLYKTNKYVTYMYNEEICPHDDVSHAMHDIFAVQYGSVNPKYLDN